MDVYVFRDTESAAKANGDRHHGLSFDLHLVDEPHSPKDAATTKRLTDLVAEARTQRRTVAVYRRTHYTSSDHLRLIHYAVGFALILASAIVSGSVLQATGDNPSKTLTLTAGILSIIVVVLTAIQTTFKLGERGEQHRTVAAGLGECGRELDCLIASDPTDPDKAEKALSAILAKISDVEKGAPGYMGWTYRRAKEAVRREEEQAIVRAAAAPR